MKFYTKLAIFLASLVFVSCSKDDSPDTDEIGQIQLPSFTALGEDIDKVFQYDYDASLDEGQLTDLTQEIGVVKQYITLRELKDVISFYTFSSGNFSLHQKNITTGETVVFENFYTRSPERSILWGTNNKEKVFFGFFTPAGSKNLGVRTIDLASGGSINLFLENNIQNAYQPLFYNGKLIVTYKDGDGFYHVTVIDSASNSIQRKLDFNDSTPNVIINDNEELVIISSNLGGSSNYEVYDLETMELKEENPILFNKFFTPGVLFGKIVDDTFYFPNPYAQPSPVVFGPAFFELDTNSETIIDIATIQNNVNVELQKIISIVSQGFDPITNLFLVGYGISDNTDLQQGGILIISLEGELVKRIEVPFVPTYFVTGIK